MSTDDPHPNGYCPKPYSLSDLLDAGLLRAAAIVHALRIRYVGDPNLTRVLDEVRDEIVNEMAASFARGSK